MNAGGVDREVVLTDGAARRDERVATTYDAVASAYADHIAGELAGKPFDQWLLTRVAELAGDGPVIDAGCGPGHVTRFLADAGATASGIDLSPGMVALARSRYPDLTFETGNLLDLPRHASGDGWAAVVAWYSLVHLAGSELAPAIAGFAAALRPGGRLALGTHAGDEVLHREEWWDHAIDVDFVQQDPGQVRAAVRAAGLVDVEWYLRGPYEGAEVETQRLYVLATKP